MQYVIFDLEWNCTHIGKDAFLNEIIEIGAVKLNSQLNEIGRFSELICPKKGKRLNKYVRGLTHIDENELKSADDLHSVLKRFKTFCKGDTLFMSWSDTDLHVFLENYRFFYHTDRIGFIKKYADLQKYVMKKLEIGSGSQPSLSAIAERLEIPDDTVSHQIPAPWSNWTERSWFCPGKEHHDPTRQVSRCRSALAARIMHGSLLRFCR